MDYNHALGLQTKARFDNLDGYGVTHYYDAFGQPTTVLLNMDGNARYTSYSHDEAGNLVRLTHPDDAAFAYSYDALGRMTAVLDNPAATSLDDYVIRYGYKPEGPRHAAVRGAGAAGFTTVSYYDALLRPESIHNDLPAAGADVYDVENRLVSAWMNRAAFPPLAPGACNPRTSGARARTASRGAILTHLAADSGRKGGRNAAFPGLCEIRIHAQRQAPGGAATAIPGPDTNQNAGAFDKRPRPFVPAGAGTPLEQSRNTRPGAIQMALRRRAGIPAS